MALTITISKKLTRFVAKSIECHPPALRLCLHLSASRDATVTASLTSLHTSIARARTLVGAFNQSTALDAIRKRLDGQLKPSAASQSCAAAAVFGRLIPPQNPPRMLLTEAERRLSTDRRRVLWPPRRVGQQCARAAFLPWLLLVARALRSRGGLGVGPSTGWRLATALAGAP